MTEFSAHEPQLSSKISPKLDFQQVMVIIGSLIMATMFWFLMFSPWTKNIGNFWIFMMSATGILSTIALYSDRDQLRMRYRFRQSHVLVGVVSAVLLYFIFWLGYILSTVLYSGVHGDLSMIYVIKENQDPRLIFLLLLFWIGPAEEIYWRGFIQAHLSDRFQDLRGFLITTALYALIHVWAFNIMLILAALVAGLFWGSMFLKFKSPWPGIISHAIWTVFIFILFPIT